MFFYVFPKKIVPKQIFDFFFISYDPHEHSYRICSLVVQVQVQVQVQHVWPCLGFKIIPPYSATLQNILNIPPYSATLHIFIHPTLFRYITYFF